MNEEKLVDKMSESVSQAIGFNLDFGISFSVDSFVSCAAKSGRGMVGMGKAGVAKQK
jgi:hypothetical protein